MTTAENEKPYVPTWTKLGSRSVKGKPSEMYYWDNFRIVFTQHTYVQEGKKVHLRASIKRLGLVKSVIFWLRHKFNR